MSRLINNILNEEFDNDTSQLILKDANKISLDYTPDNLPFREEELSQLTYLFKDVIASFNNPKHYKSVSVLIFGEKKSGKTATIKRFGIDLEKYVHSKDFLTNISFFYRHINCIRYRTFYSIFISVIQTFVPEFPIRGFSTFELIRYLKEYLEISNSYLLLALDDFNALENDKDFETILNILSDGDFDHIGTYKKRISIIIILNNTNHLKTPAYSSNVKLKDNKIYFKPYTKVQLFLILKTRAEETLQNGSWDDKDLSHIVGLTTNKLTKTTDPRLALEILWRSARISEQKMLRKITVFDDLLDVEIPFDSEKINLDLKIQEKVILYCTARIFIKNPNQAFTKIKEIKKEFDQLKTSFNIPFKALGYTSIFNYLQELKKLNLIVTQVTNTQKKGRTTVIKLNINPSHVELLLHNQILKQD